MQKLTLHGCLAIALIASSLTTDVTCLATVEVPLDVSLRQLIDNPAAYNHKLLRITGVVSHGFEDFTFSDATLSATEAIWLEYGGRVASKTTYCCGPVPGARRADILTIDGIRIPLRRDRNFSAFDRLVKRSTDVTFHATLIGRFFAVVRTPGPEGDALSGYGHFGCFSLLAIQQVVSIGAIEHVPQASPN